VAAMSVDDWKPIGRHRQINIHKGGQT